MISLLFLPMCLSRPLNITKRCSEGKSVYLAVVCRPASTSYLSDIYHDSGKLFEISECCSGFSKNENGICVEDIIKHSFPKSAVPRFIAAMSLMLIVWILVGVFSLLIAYITLSHRRKDAARLLDNEPL
ncbi:hypothetical protein Q1695_010610 [Nippostrongylus brasiliensis]|nr:hypothetical protein Q1695_010610 [Nippostrongylus brasiliensis]